MEFVPSKELIEYIKSEEGFDETPRKDGNGFAIGHGNHYFYPNGKAVSVKETDGPITIQQAHDLCYISLTHYMKELGNYIKRNDLKQYQFEALTSVLYNCGGGNFQKSSLCKLVNEDPNSVLIKDAFLKCCASDKAHKDRRTREYYFYFTGKPNYKTGYTPTNMETSSNLDSSADAMSTDSKVQVKYINTNYCSSTSCTDDSYDVGGYSGQGYNDGSKPDQISNSINKSSAINILIEADGKGFMLTDWKYDKRIMVHTSKGNVAGDRFTSVIKKGSYVVGTVYVSIAESKDYSVRIVQRVGNVDKLSQNILSGNLESNKTNESTNGGYNPMANVYSKFGTSTTSKDNLIKTRDKLNSGIMNSYKNVSPIDEFNMIILSSPNKYKGNQMYRKFEDIINKKGPDNDYSLFDVLYKHYKKKGEYKKVSFETEYRSLREDCRNPKAEKFEELSEITINDNGVSKYAKKNKLIYFTDIDVDCNIKGKEDYFGNSKRAVALLFGNNNVVRFTTGLSRNAGGWDNIHMIFK